MAGNFRNRVVAAVNRSPEALALQRGLCFGYDMDIIGYNSEDFPRFGQSYPVIRVGSENGYIVYKYDTWVDGPWKDVADEALSELEAALDARDLTAKTEEENKKTKAIADSKQRAENAKEEAQRLFLSLQPNGFDGEEN